MDENIQQENNNNESKAMAIVSMILGILGLILLCLPFLSLILSVLALIFGIVVVYKKVLEKVWELQVWFVEYSVFYMEYTSPSFILLHFMQLNRNYTNH